MSCRMRSRQLSSVLTAAPQTPLYFSSPGNDRCAALAVGRERSFEQRPAHKAEGFVVHAAVAGLQQGAAQVLGGRKTEGATSEYAVRVRRQLHCIAAGLRKVEHGCTHAQLQCSQGDSRQFLLGPCSSLPRCTLGQRGRSVGGVKP